MPSSSLPWIARFEALRTESAIRQRSYRMPRPLELASTASPTDVEVRVGSTLAEIYYPTRQDVAILSRLRDLAKAYCECAYESEQRYASKLHATIKTTTGTFSNPICLTGLAGVGKSQVIDAFCRLFTDTRIQVLDGLLASPMKGPIKVTLQRDLGLKTYLNDYINLGVKNPKAYSLKDALACFPHRAYARGAPFVLIDETQFKVGGSSTSSIRNILLQFTQFGIPLLFVANLSLVRALSRSPEQLRHRLLTRPIEVGRDEAGSDDWLAFLRCCHTSLGETISLDVLSEQEVIHQLTGGIKRMVVDLLKISYRHSRGSKKIRQVTMDHVQAAYRSSDYAISRHQLKALSDYVISGNPKSEYHNPLGPSRLERGFDTSNTEDPTLKEIARRASLMQVPVNSKDNNPHVERRLAADPSAPRSRRSRPTAGDLSSNAIRLGKGLYGSQN